MRLVTFAASGRERIGALIDNDRRIVDFLAAHDGAGPAFQNMQALIEGGAAALDRAREMVAAGQKSGRRGIDTANGKTAGAAAVAATIARLPVFRKALDTGLHPDTPNPRCQRAGSGTGATRIGETR